MVRERQPELDCDLPGDTRRERRRRLGAAPSGAHHHAGDRADRCAGGHAAAEQPLPVFAVGGPLAEHHHVGQFEAFAPGQPDGRDRLVLEGVEHRQAGLGHRAGEQAGHLRRRHREHHAIGCDRTGIGRCLPAAGDVARQPAAGGAPAQRGAPRGQPIAGRFGHHRAQGGARQQEVRIRGARQQRIAEDLGERACAGARRRRVERPDAQRRPDPGDQRCGLPMGGEPLRDGAALGHRVRAACRETRHRAEHRDALAPRHAAGSQQADPEVQWCGQRGGAQLEAARAGQSQPRAHEHRCGIGADAADQFERRAVGADQQVLTVVDVERRVRIDPKRQGTRAPAGHGRCVDHGDPLTRLEQSDGRGQAGPAGADDQGVAHPPPDARRAASKPGGLPATQVRHASQSLRIGVSEVRRSSTRKSSRAISSSSVA